MKRILFIIGLSLIVLPQIIGQEAEKNNLQELFQNCEHQLPDDHLTGNRPKYHRLIQSLEDQELVIIRLYEDSTYYYSRFYPRLRNIDGHKTVYFVRTNNISLIDSLQPKMYHALTGLHVKLLNANCFDSFITNNPDLMSYFKVIE